MSDDSTTQRLLFPGIFRKPVVAQFDHREGSSDGGALLREEKEQWTIHRVAADDTEKVADEAEYGESRASATHARTHPRTRQVAAGGCGWTLSLLRSAQEPTSAGDFSIPSRLVLASLAVAAEPERPGSLGPNAAPHQSLAASAFCLSSLSFAPHGH